MPPTNQAAAQLNPVYNQAQAGIQAQTPALTGLYGALLQGLQAQNQAQIANVVGGAQRAGVATPTTGQQAGDLLSGVLAQQTGQLGVNQAQGVAGLNQEAGKLNVQRAGDINTLANSLQNLSQINQKAAFANKQNQQQYQLGLQKAQQDYNVQAQNYATAQARAAAKAQQSAANFDLSTVSQSTLTRQLRLGLNSLKGSDNHVSPQNLAKAYATWMQAGLTPETFWKAFQGDWNPKQKNYGDIFHAYVNQYVGG